MKKFQYYNGLTADGIAGDKTQTYLFENPDVFPNPEAGPTEAPATEVPTPEVTEAPTEAPTEEPTEAPTEAPAEEPTAEPTAEPTEAPAEEPTEVPAETEAPEMTEEPEETTEHVIGMLDSYHRSLSVIAKDKATLFCVMVLSLIYRIALCSMPYFVLKMFSAPVGFFHVFATTIYIYATICLVPTPGNAGAAEGAFYLVFSAMGSDGVFWAMLIWRLFCHYSFIIIGAVIYGVNALCGKRGRERKSE